MYVQHFLAQVPPVCLISRYAFKIVGLYPLFLQVEIDFIDRGNREKVSNITLREIPDNLKELKSLPPQVWCVIDLLLGGICLCPNRLVSSVPITFLE